MFRPVTASRSSQTGGQVLFPALTAVTVAGEDFHAQHRGRSADRIGVALNDGEGR
ncbi:hypothetical protein [Streptomyces clavuligerus]|uniref:hypothetical protein n=1 Tax=Streptomyces clavuligerus TaxID=1901 RepID=UPI00017FF5E1|nr:hypothetical protein [Streptomyces clavuligerus]EDY49210.1 hypothetical protein SSCG_02238 [Streptomyces clavuligerus]WDN56124.1 hypothetical protein LL058_30150 [Streptomyces clavuligerus]